MKPGLLEIPCDSQSRDSVSPQAAQANASVQDSSVQNPNVIVSAARSPLYVDCIF
ncbi:hypothetical protein GALL_21370 [mine drainage metagenome]|uniref:Uncharacterized protein n=1 Tax=mine drainage metagenome TaxID=410659 RepID=A0A1J5TLE4_9ZZZZ